MNLNGFDTSNYDDDRTYYDGYDDVYVVTINGHKLKFVQNYENNKYINFTLYYKNGDFYGYDDIKAELSKNVLTK